MDRVVTKEMWDRLHDNCEFCGKRKHHDELIFMDETGFKPVCLGGCGGDLETTAAKIAARKA